MKPRFFLLPLLCLMLCLSAASADGLRPAVELPGQLPVSQVWAAGSALPMQLITEVTDDDPATCWDAAAGGMDGVSSAYLMLSFDQPASVSDLWIRNGDQTSENTYSSHGYPTRIAVTLWRRLPDGSNAAAAQYIYTLQTDVSLNSYTDLARIGYQRLPLPGTHDDIVSVVININAWQPGAYSTVRISDVAICGPAAAPSMPEYDGVEDDNSSLYAVLNQKMATRTGPGTQYTEPGTFLAKGEAVEIISLVYDKNDIPWVQVDFTAYGSHRRAYTGLKRLEIGAEYIPVEKPLNYSATIRNDVTPRYGPGNDYMKYKDVTLSAGEHATVISRENGWMMIEIARPDQPLMRVWLQEEHVRW